MKGLILSVFVFLLYLVSVIIACQLKQFERHSKLFLPVFIFFIPVYIVLYFITPENLWILPKILTTKYRYLELIYGLLLYVLNFHNQLDFFYTVNGGFSTCILVEIRKSEKGLKKEEIVNMFKKPGESINKIFSWRLPRLAETGYINFDDKKGIVKLTSKGKIVAMLVKFLKTVLNVPKEGV